MRLDMQSETE